MPVHVVVNGPLPPGVLKDEVKSAIPLGDPVHFVRADKAIEAMDALAAGLALPSDTSAFDRFQHRFLQSGMGPTQSAILQSVISLKQYQILSARRTAQQALGYAENMLASERQTAKQVANVIAELGRTAQQAASRAKQMSVVGRSIEGGIIQGGVKDSMHRAKAAVSAVLDDRLSWWYLVSRARVDDVGIELDTCLDRSFGREIEMQVSHAKYTADRSSFSRAANCHVSNLSSRMRPIA